MFGFAVGFCLPLVLLAWVALGVVGLSIPKHGLRLVVSSGDREKKHMAARICCSAPSSQG